MARIQILELPTEVVGEFVRTPFALVVDQMDARDVVHEVDEFRKMIGAAGALVTSDTIEVVR